MQFILSHVRRVAMIELLGRYGPEDSYDRMEHCNVVVPQSNKMAATMSRASLIRQFVTTDRDDVIDEINDGTQHKL